MIAFFRGTEMFWVLIVVFLMWAIPRFYLSGEDLSKYDSPAKADFGGGIEPNAELEASLKTLFGEASEMQSMSRKARLTFMREFMDNMFVDHEFTGSFTTVDVDGVPAEWVVAPGADPDRRLLYIHGGAFTMGSPRSHRVITHRFSEIANAAVLAIDYRLMPENHRQHGNDDCRTAYLWILKNGPETTTPSSWLGIAGDSAGGNLTLALSNWIRDQGLQTPDRVVALSPTTDGTMGSPSARSNMKTDAMLRPMFEQLAKVPRFILLWGSWIYTRIRPCDPKISPIFDSLANLPPTLVHASETEILLDDARRYVNKARSQGSPVKLQTWDRMPHVWQMFYPTLPEAGDAFQEIEKFLTQPPD
ncbi:MAG: monoterpene epsilon-lactone hydrolase [Halieaceae bacterium]|jgi:monoterpene epsilon-lactone hydrolase